MRNAWDRMEDESERAHSAFVVYRDLGPKERSIPAAAAIDGRSAHTLREFSERYRWGERVAAFDDWCDMRRIERAEQARASAEAELRAKGRDALTAATASLEPYLDGSKEIAAAYLPKFLAIAKDLMLLGYTTKQTSSHQAAERIEDALERLAKEGV